MKFPDRRSWGNNKLGNPNIAEEGRKWRQRTPNWKAILTQISRERSTGAKTSIGKFRSSLNAIKYKLGSPSSRISADSMIGQFLLLHSERLEEKNSIKIH